MPCVEKCIVRRLNINGGHETDGRTDRLTDSKRGVSGNGAS